MKRLNLFLLLAAVTLSGMAQAVGEAVYIYRNDGQFNAFLRSEVISIDYSYEDAEGNTYDEIVTQIVNTADSVYKIPLAAIDSVGFVQPETIISHDVFPLTAEHLPFITNGDVLSFTMSASTPDTLRPQLSNIVVATAECTAFPDGIIAKVEEIRETGAGFQYVCSQAYYDDVFDQLIAYQPAIDDDMAEAARNFDLRRASTTATLWDVKWSKTIEHGGTTASLNVGDRSTATVTVCISKALTTSFYFQLQLQNTLTSQVGFHAKSTSSTSKEAQLGTTITAGRITIPYTMGLLWLEPKLSLYGYFDEQGRVDLDYSGHFNRTDKVTFTYTQGKWDLSHSPLTDVATDVACLSMEGSAEIGLRPQIDFSLNGRQAGFGLKASAGLKEYINFVFDATKLSDGSLYDTMRDSYCRTTIPWSVTVHANANIFSRYDATQSDDGTATYSHTFAPKSEPQWGDDRYIFPLFADVSAVRQIGDKTLADASASVSRIPLVPVQLGFSLLDKDGNILQTEYSGQTYQAGSPLESYQCVLSDLGEDEEYTVRPSVKLFGYDVLASPGTEVVTIEITCPDGNHPHAIDLGLPSGTLWQCCNEGASTPEEYGGYYLFGQIASAPSLEQIMELLNYTTSVWVRQNGVNGRKFIGVNGATIFLPAAGSIWNGVLCDEGSGGYYWSAVPLDGDYACELFFFPDNVNWGSYDYYPSYSNPVRPVYSK